MIAEEAKKRQATSGPGVYGGKTPFPKNEKSDYKPIHADEEVAKKFDVSKGYVHKAQKIKDAAILPDVTR